MEDGSQEQPQRFHLLVSRPAAMQSQHMQGNGVDSGFQQSSTHKAFEVGPSNGVAPPDPYIRFALDCSQSIRHWVRVYMTIVYPLFPVFIGNELQTISDNDFRIHDRALHVSILAACAIAAARIRDGATGCEPAGIQVYAEREAAAFLLFAREAMPERFDNALKFEYLRAHALLALLALQNGNLVAMHEHIGHYHTLSSMHRLNNESAWPKNLPNSAKESRRLLFWSMYRMDVFAATHFQSLPRSRELEANVTYPQQCDDGSNLNVTSQSWLQAWNFNTDLYRILEHLLERARRTQRKSCALQSPTQPLTANGFSDAQVLVYVRALVNSLPPEFRDFENPRTRSDDYTFFQAANIRATLQSFNVLLLECSGSKDIIKRCDAVQRTLATFQNMDLARLRILSCPFLYHLSGMGRALVSAATTQEYPEEVTQRVRSLLSSMVELMVSLEPQNRPSERLVSTALIDFLSSYAIKRRDSVAAKSEGTPIIEDQENREQQMPATTSLDLENTHSIINPQDPRLEAGPFTAGDSQHHNSNPEQSESWTNAVPPLM